MAVGQSAYSHWRLSRPLWGVALLGHRDGRVCVGIDGAGHTLTHITADPETDVGTKIKIHTAGATATLRAHTELPLAPITITLRQYP